MATVVSVYFSKKVTLRVVWVVAIIFSVVGVSCPARAADLDESCTVSILNRNVQPKNDGTWVLPNVPATFGRVRARATCVKDGITRSGESPFFFIPVRGSVNVPPIVLGSTTPIPTSLRIVAARKELTSPNETVQLAVTASYRDSPSLDVTGANKGTSFSVSNPSIATISELGLLTAVKSGTVVVQALHEGVSGVESFKIAFGGGFDTDGDGIPDSDEIELGLNPNNRIDALLDLDNDGLTNLEEYNAGTDLQNSDTDNDGLSDFEEVRGIKGPATSPLLADTDGDGVRDRVEVESGSDPNDATSINLGQVLKGISVRPGSFSLVINSLTGSASVQLSVLGQLIDDSLIDLTASRRGTTYSSSNLGVCNFNSESGKVFASSLGTCTITVNNSGFSTTVQGTVTNFTPSQLSAISLPGYANDIAVSGEYAYIAVGGIGLQVVGVSSGRTSPVILSTLPLEGVPHAVEVVGSIAYVASGSGGLYIVDISDPLLPFIISRFQTGGVARGVKVYDSVIYLAVDDKIQILDVSKHINPELISTLSVGGASWNLDVDGVQKLLAVASGNTGVSLLDVSAPAAPRVLFTLPTGDARAVALKGNNLYVADRQNSMRLIDISSRTAPRIVNSTLRNQVGLLNDIALSGDFAFGADVFFTNSVPIVDISTPDALNPRPLLNFTSQDGNGMGIAVDDFFTYLVTVRAGTERGGSTVNGSRLYIGQFRPRVDTLGVPPTSSLRNIEENYSALEGETIVLKASATDDIAVERVSYFVNGVPVFNSTVAPYKFEYKVPRGFSSVQFGVVATDIAGNQSAMSTISIRVSPDPKTIVRGRVVDIDGVPLVGASVSTVEGKSSSTRADGSFDILDVVTTAGPLLVGATFTESPQSLLRGKSLQFQPARGGITEVGTIEALPAQIQNSGNLVSIGDNSSFLQTLPFPFTFYGVQYTSVYVGTNGYLTFTRDDRTVTKSLPVFVGLPRIAPFFDDLNPALGGIGAGVSVNRSIPGKFVVTYDRVGVNGFTGENSIQVQLFQNGRIVFAYDGIAAVASGAMVGISPGLDVPLQELNFARILNQNIPLSSTLYEAFPRSSPFDMDKGFIIFSPLATGGYNVRTLR
jgi:hypothetical protein